MLPHTSNPTFPFIYTLRWSLAPRQKHRTRDRCRCRSGESRRQHTCTATSLCLLRTGVYFRSHFERLDQNAFSLFKNWPNKNLHYSKSSCLSKMASLRDLYYLFICSVRIYSVRNCPVPLCMLHSTPGAHRDTASGGHQNGGAAVGTWGCWGRGCSWRSSFLLCRYFFTAKLILSITTLSY